MFQWIPAISAQFNFFSIMFFVRFVRFVSFRLCHRSTLDWRRRRPRLQQHLQLNYRTLVSWGNLLYIHGRTRACKRIVWKRKRKKYKLNSFRWGQASQALPVFPAQHHTQNLWENEKKKKPKWLKEISFYLCFCVRWSFLVSSGTPVCV